MIDRCVRCKTINSYTSIRGCATSCAGKSDRYSSKWKLCRRVAGWRHKDFWLYDRLARFMYLWTGVILFVWMINTIVLNYLFPYLFLRWWLILQDEVVNSHIHMALMLRANRSVDTLPPADGIRMRRWVAIDGVTCSDWVILCRKSVRGTQYDLIVPSQTDLQ
jgi:hypothetical protein